jgi:hypothetical protein
VVVRYELAKVFAEIESALIERPARSKTRKHVVSGKGAAALVPASALKKPEREAFRIAFTKIRQYDGVLGS